MTSKLRSLDAICAKLKSIGGDEIVKPSKRTDQEEAFQVVKLENGQPETQNGASDLEKEDKVKSTMDTEKENNGGSTRRKSRKATVPRNIMQVREILDKLDCVGDNDELAEYELNNQNTNFPPDDVEEDSGNEESLKSSCVQEDTFSTPMKDVEKDLAASPVSSSINDSLQDRKQPRKPRKSTPSYNNTGTMGTPLDLSVTKSSDSDIVLSSQNLRDTASNSSQLDVTNDELKSKEESCSQSKEMKLDTKVKSTEKNEKHEMTALKDYAETTMNELLSMYGFSGAGDAITRQIPMNNFTSKQILHEQIPVPIQEPLKAVTPINSSPILTNGLAVASPLSSNAEKKGIYTNYVSPVTSKNGQPTKAKTPNAEGVKDDKFTNSAAYIKAVFNAQTPGTSTPNKHPGLPDYSKYLKRFSNGTDCKVKYCKELGYREHFHCMDCNFRVFVKKEEMVRHYKWHRKREESLQHGFMRYSPMDDCCQKYGSCTHNGRQTHYHCLQLGCDKVYISTSDVQMHANYHRKDSAIIQEGFQRFRATEDCGTPMCAFYGQRTTHFHCRRPGCNFTFKNKADMEKHKTYHQKDEVLSRDGFKKFMKYEHCGYIGCRYSKLSNHIHCIRPGCIYVLHSTAQLFSHKRKHERRDFETAYRKFREDSNDGPKDQNFQFGGGNLVNNNIPAFSSSPQGHMSLPIAIKTEITDDDFDESCDSRKQQSEQSLDENSNSDMKSTYSDTSEIMDISQIKTEKEEDQSLLTKHAAEVVGEKLNDSLTLPIPIYNKPEEKPKVQNHITPPPQASKPVEVGPAVFANHIPTLVVSSQQIVQPHQLQPVLSKPSTNTQEKKERDESWKTYLIRYTANDPCNSRCQYLYKDHYHCRVDGCLVLFKSKDGVREHARFHELQDRITPVAYNMYEKEDSCPENCQYNGSQRHYHCIWSGCTHVVPHDGPTFGRLEHYRIHEFARNSVGKSYKTSPSKASDDMPRKRGRPPKYPKNSIPVIPKVEMTESEIQKSHDNLDPSIVNGFKKFTEDEPCPDELCLYKMKEHYHCARPRCYQATDRLDVLNLHAKDFHSFVTIIEGFEFFDRNVDCRRAHCHNNKANRHFHCIRPKCDYSFVRHSTMIQHNKKHENVETTPTVKEENLIPVKQEIVSPSGFIPIAPADSKGLIKTSGTFYPLSGLTSGHSNVHVSTVAALDTSVLHSLAVSAIPSGSITAGSMVTAPITTSILTAASGLLPNSGHPLPLAVLLQQRCNPLPQPSWEDLKIKMHYGLDQNCGRPFCKLKKKDHFHCFDCNQAFSDINRVRAHVSKHGLKSIKIDDSTLSTIEKPVLPITIAPKPEQNPVPIIPSTATEFDVQTPNNNSDDDDNHSVDEELNASDSLNLNPSTFSNLIAKAQKAHCTPDMPNSGVDLDESMEGKLVIAESENSNNISDEALDDSITNRSDTSPEDSVKMDIESSVSKRSGRKRTRTKLNDFIDSNDIPVKQKKLNSTSSAKSTKDDSIPEGFIRVRHKDDCQYSKCAYRQGITHFHCSRPDCGYSFSDRSRLIQHTLRHERIDSLTGGEMQQYRMSQPCNRQFCEYQGKASHFHCLKCDYNCTDSSKVLTHRKYHSKLDNINSQGFQKFSVSEKCDIESCPYVLKQTHYHCIKPGCNYAVLGPAQITSHNIKHANDSL